VGVDAVLVTCDDDNIASAIVIERGGGGLDDAGLAPNEARTRRYWIT
jgi:predicted acetyltransferase